MKVSGYFLKMAGTILKDQLISPEISNVRIKKLSQMYY